MINKRIIYHKVICGYKINQNELVLYRSHVNLVHIIHFSAVYICNGHFILVKVYVHNTDGDVYMQVLTYPTV